jgi:hypothetical protein
MVTLSSLVSSIEGVIQDPAYTGEVLIDMINDVISEISAGIRMPNGEISPPLPDLQAYDTVTTSVTLPYVSLPSDYQRKVTHIVDDTKSRISSPNGGSYYAFSKFISQCSDMDLSEQGEIYVVAIKGNRIYYQGIPTAAKVIGIHYYRKASTLTLEGDTVEGIPEHLAKNLIKHGVIKDIYGDMIEAGVTEPARGMDYHTKKFYSLMENLCDFVGIDAEPIYYGSDTESYDGAICDG